MSLVRIVTRVYFIFQAEDGIRDWSVTGVQTCALPISAGVNGQWVFNQPFFILMNLAIGGGGFPGFTNGSTPNPATMLVDYVRVYRADNGGGINSSAWYNVINQNSGACVDATGFGTANGTAVQQWACGNGQIN